MHRVVGAKGQVTELGTDYLRVLMGGSFTIFLVLRTHHADARARQREDARRLADRGERPELVSGGCS